MSDGRSNQQDFGGQQQPPGNRYKKIPVLTLVLWAGIIAATVVLFFMKQHIREPARQITQAEFFDKFASNQIVRATVVVNQQALPLVEITGTYLKTDQNGEATKDEIQFTVHNFLLTGEAERELTHSPKITISSPNTVLTNVLWGIAPFLTLGLLFWFFLMRQIKAK